MRYARAYLGIRARGAARHAGVAANAARTCEQCVQAALRRQHETL